jgi:glutathione synthase/RimK-type ligase-like ATP-grasp enzyme
MRQLREFRAGKPAFYPDQAVYAEYACAEIGLTFQDIDGGTGLVFSVASKRSRIHFGAGRCSWYPQNSSTAATLASDKYFTNAILENAGIATLGGDYFFLRDRHRALRPRAHERADAFDYFRKLDSTAFAKPLQGSRGDFAQILRGEAALDRYLQAVSQTYDAVLIQPIVTGLEYRIFLLDGEIAYSVRKYPPFVLGDGVRAIRELLIAHNAALQARGLSSVSATEIAALSLDAVLPEGERWEIPGRMNLSAGGKMVFEAPGSAAAFTVAKQAVLALGLRVAAVDLFTNIGGDPEAIRVIEVNSNPSIRILEELERSDLILKIWRHTFSAVGLLDV